MEFQELSTMTNKEITQLLSKLVSKINDLESTRKIGDTTTKIELSWIVFVSKFTQYGKNRERERRPGLAEYFRVPANSTGIK